MSKKNQLKAKRKKNKNFPIWKVFIIKNEQDSPYDLDLNLSEL